MELPSEDLVTYTWNADFKRVGKDDGVDQTVYVWDQNHLLVETDDLSVPIVQYTNEPDEYGNLLSQNRDSASSFYHYDHQQSTRALTDGSEVVTDDYTYEAYGEVLDSTGTTANPYQWVGQLSYYHDEDTGWYSLRRREYDPATGRFLSQDPIGYESGDENFYRYVTNSPVGSVDPSGLGPYLPYDIFLSGEGNQGAYGPSPGTSPDGDSPVDALIQQLSFSTVTDPASIPADVMETMARTEFFQWKPEVVHYWWTWEIEPGSLIKGCKDLTDGRDTPPIVAVVTVPWIDSDGASHEALAVYIRKVTCTGQYYSSLNGLEENCPFDDNFQLVSIFSNLSGGKTAAGLANNVFLDWESNKNIETVTGLTATLKLVPFGTLAHDVATNAFSLDTVVATVLDAPSIAIPLAKGLKGVGWVRTAKGVVWASTAIDIYSSGKAIWDGGNSIFVKQEPLGALQIVLGLIQLKTAKSELASFYDGNLPSAKLPGPYKKILSQSLVAPITALAKAHELFLDIFSFPFIKFCSKECKLYVKRIRQAQLLVNDNSTRSALMRLEREALGVQQRWLIGVNASTTESAIKAFDKEMKEELETLVRVTNQVADGFPRAKSAFDAIDAVVTIPSPNENLTLWAKKQSHWLNPMKNQLEAYAGRLYPDHVYPKKFIEGLPRFGELDRKYQDYLLNYPGNFEPLPLEWNSSKRDRWAKDWANIGMGKRATKEYIRVLQERQEAFEGFATNLISFWLDKSKP